MVTVPNYFTEADMGMLTYEIANLVVEEGGEFCSKDYEMFVERFVGTFGSEFNTAPTDK